MYWSKVTPLLNLVPVSSQKCEDYPKTPGAGLFKLVVLLVWWDPQKQKAVGCQGGEVCRRRHPLNPQHSSIGLQGETEPRENKD
jgi:hypothetical protein